MVYPRISKDIPFLSSLMDIHGISKDIPCIYQANEGGLHIRGIYQAYSRHIPVIGDPDDWCNFKNSQRSNREMRSAMPRAGRRHTVVLRNPKDSIVIIGKS